MKNKTILRIILVLYAAMMIASLFACDKAGSDEDQALVLEPVGTFSNTNIDESSGIIQSSHDTSLYWTHNDSGGDAVLYSVKADGTSGSTAAITISDATNIDWEDITMDGDGNIYVGDIGNNNPPYFERDNLCLYKISEPDLESSTVSGAVAIPFVYPDYSFATRYNYDAEAIFWSDGTVYLLTKHYLDTMSILYRFDDLSGSETTTLTRIDSFDAQGSVSAADASADGNRLVVLANVYVGYPSTAITSSIIWLFEVTSGDNYFNGTKYRLRIDAGQCEAICFMDDNTLLITNEEKQLFTVNVDQLIEIK